MNPEERLKRKVKIVKAVSVALLVALIVMVCLYVTALDSIRRQYLSAYQASVAEVGDLLVSYEEEDFDRDTKYMAATASLNTARQMIFLYRPDEKEEICLNQLYYAFLKYPGQMRERIGQVREAIEKLEANAFDDDAYQALTDIVDGLDKLGS